MKGLRIAITIGVSLILMGNGKCQERAMEERNVKLTIRPFTLKDAPSIAALKLLETPQGLQLISSITKRASSGVGAETIISGSSLTRNDQKLMTMFTLEQMLPPPPTWDIAVNTNGAYAVVYESALGATYVLNLITASQNQMSLPADYAAESYTSPNFVRRQMNDAARHISAIVDKKYGVIFARRTDGGYAQPVKLCDCAEAVILPHRDGYLLFYKVIVPGAVRGKLISPGKLYWSRLDRGFVPIGGPHEVLADQTVFEFEVDVADGFVAILATTANGTKLALSPGPEDRLAITPVDEVRRGEMFSRPSVVVTKGQVYVALLENALSNQARVLIGSASVATLR